MGTLGWRCLGCLQKNLTGEAAKPDRPTVVRSGLNQKAWCGVLKDVFIISVKPGLRQPSSPQTLLGKQQGYSSICWWWWCHIRYRISCIPTKYHYTGLQGKSILFNNPAQNPGYVWFLPYVFCFVALVTFCWITAVPGSPSHVKSGVATSWMGISFRKAGFWQRGFPLTTRVFFSHWPSQAKWQSHTYGLDRRLLWKTKTQVKWILQQRIWDEMNTDLEIFLTLTFGFS